MSDAGPLTAQDALVVLMISVSAADGNIRTSELVKISNAINNLPVFAGYDVERVPQMSQLVFELL